MSVEAWHCIQTTDFTLHQFAVQQHATDGMMRLELQQAKGYMVILCTEP